MGKIENGDALRIQFRAVDLVEVGPADDRLGLADAIERGAPPPRRWKLTDVTDNGDGTYTATAPPEVASLLRSAPDLLRVRSDFTLVPDGRPR